MPTFIGTELENTGKFAMDKNFNEEKEAEESKVDNVEESKVSITSINKKNDKLDTSITSTRKKKYIVYKIEESRDNSVSNRQNKISLLEKIIKPSEVIITREI